MSRFKLSISGGADGPRVVPISINTPPKLVPTRDSMRQLPRVPDLLHLTRSLSVAFLALLLVAIGSPTAAAASWQSSGQGPVQCHVHDGFIVCGVCWDEEDSYRPPVVDADGFVVWIPFPDGAFQKAGFHPSCDDMV